VDSRERLRRAYYLEEMDRPAVYSRISSVPWDDKSYDRLGAFLATESDQKVVWDGRAFEACYPVSHAAEPYSEDFERQITILHTPAGDLRASKRVGLKYQPGLQETFFIKTREDVEKYLSLPLPDRSGDASSFFVADREIGERGIVDVSLGFNPAGFVAELCGTETFALLSVTDRDLLHALCQRQMEIMLDTVKFLLGQGVGPFFSMAGEEYLVPPLHGPTDFDDFNVRYDKPIIDLVHQGGGRVYIHCHGSVKKVMQGFLAMGVDVLHPFEAPPMGDITPSEAKETIRGRMCYEGNIQIHHMYEHTPEAVREETIALIEDVFDDGLGLIVCPTASPYIPGAGEVCLGRFRAMVEAVHDWAGRGK
jgi:hypothetical protein